MEENREDMESREEASDRRSPDFFPRQEVNSIGTEKIKINF